ncbi:MAG: hypothetical protein DPW18_18015 [Chloroflexi bacterium]|nr:hypothetical protein [Chloroflexota bacterium]
MSASLRNIEASEPEAAYPAWKCWHRLRFTQEARWKPIASLFVLMEDLTQQGRLNHVSRKLSTKGGRRCADT